MTQNPRHRWGDKVVFPHKSERDCINCGLVKVSRHEVEGGRDRYWTEYWRDEEKVESDRTPVCERVGGAGMNAPALNPQPEIYHYDRDRAPGVYVALDVSKGESREHALLVAVNEMVAKTRRYMENKDGEGTCWSEGFGNSVIAWALSLSLSKDVKEEGLVQAAAADVEGESDHPASWEDGRAAALNAILRGEPIDSGLARGLVGEGFLHATATKLIVTDEGRAFLASDADRVIEDSHSEHAGNLNQPIAEQKDSIGITDPIIVRSLIEAHRARKTYPAGHTFSMTNPEIDGVMVTRGTCSCGDFFSYPYGSAGHEKMDAAIEAHWQKFDNLPDKIDGRGQPILGSDGGVESRHAGKAEGRRAVSAGLSRPDLIAESGVVTPPHAMDEGTSTVGVAPGPSEAKPKRPRKRKPSDAPEGIPASIIADASSSPEALRSEPAPSPMPPDGAGSLLSEDAPIGAGSLAHDMAARPADDWSPLLNAALDLAWREPVKVTPQLAALLDFSKVYAAGAEVERPVLRWHGGKWRLAPWIISHFPEHRVYVEPFGGAASVLLRKRRSYAEVYNDLDREVVSFFRILQAPDQCARLVELLYVTPFAREEFELGYLETDDPVERARRLVIRAFMGHGSDSMAGVVSGFRANSNKSGTTPAHDWANYVKALPLAVERMRGLVVEQRDAVQVMTTHDAETTLHYVDPPYMPDTRSWMTSGKGKGNYRHELGPEDHASLLASLRGLKGMVVLSGYPHELYDSELTGWRRIEIDAFADGARPRTEVLWLNPACSTALDAQHPQLFDLATFDAVNTPPPHGLERE